MLLLLGECTLSTLFTPLFYDPTEIPQLDPTLRIEILDKHTGQFLRIFLSYQMEIMIV